MSCELTQVDVLIVVSGLVLVATRQMVGVGDVEKRGRGFDIKSI